MSRPASPDGAGIQSQYSLRWNNHHAHIQQAFQSLQQSELLVDVSLVCGQATFKAHKIVLSICSPFFERIFSEHPCKHPVIVLKDFPGPEISALIDFMYKGEVRVERDDLPALMHAAESLQVRGLVSTEPQPVSPPETPTTDLLDEARSTPDAVRHQMLTDDAAPEEDDENLSEYMGDDSTAQLPSLPSRDIMLSRDPHRLPHMSHLNFSMRELRDHCSSPLIPRRKQARPRRRSGELHPRDLSKSHPPSSLTPPNTGLDLSNSQSKEQHQQQTTVQRQHSPSSHHQQQSEQHSQQEQQHSQHSSNHEEEAENLSMKKEPKRSLSPATSTDHMMKSESEAASSPRESPCTNSSGLHPDAPYADMPAAGLTAMSALSLTPPPHHPSSEYLTSLGQFTAQWLPPNHQNLMSGGSAHPRHHRDESPHGVKPGGYPYQPSDSPLAPRSAFPMDGMPPLGGAAGLFPPGGPLDLHDSFKSEGFHGLFMGAGLGHSPGKKPKKHRADGLARRWSDHSRGLPVCRPKGQHSAPRGGPPRSWTNADLTEALTMVWNKKMTTSQASRVYGIPYNSLLMYVRGKYGKSLKLEQLRKDCAAGEVMNSLNNNVKTIEPASSRLPSFAGLPPHPGDAEAANFAHHPLFGGAALGQSFFPDLANFPVPVNMVHLLPPSEQKSFDAPSNSQQPGSNNNNNSSTSNNNNPSNGQHQATRPDDLSQAGNKSRSPSPVHLGQQHEGMLPPPAQSAPTLVQQNGSD